jgi:diguanylate cyclase (GGDEF)-like protein
MENSLDTIFILAFPSKTSSDAKPRSIQLEGFKVEYKSVLELNIKSFQLDVGNPKAILLNIEQVDENSLLIIRKLYEIATHLPIIILSDAQPQHSLVQLFEAGAQDLFVTTDATPSQLNWTIWKAVARHQMRVNLQKTAMEIEERENQLSLLIERNADGVLIVDRKGRILFANPAAERLFDSKMAGLLGVDFGFPIQIDDTIEIDILNRKEQRYAEMRVVDTTWNREPVFLVSLRDVTDRVQAEKQMRHLATHDALTNLPNRILFFDRLDQAITRAQRQNSKLAILFLDLDGFKTVNDQFGHATGDTTLQIVARRLESCLRQSDTVARMGGDEFTIILENITSPQDCEQVASKILEAIQEPIKFDTKQVQLSTSIGISIFPEDGEDGDLLTIHADAAMYMAKENRNHYEFYTSQVLT